LPDGLAKNASAAFCPNENRVRVTCACERVRENVQGIHPDVRENVQGIHPEERLAGGTSCLAPHIGNFLQEYQFDTLSNMQNRSLGSAFPEPYFSGYVRSARPS